MASGRSGEAKLPDFGPDNKAHMPQQFIRVSWGKPVVRRAFQSQ